jgi:hypothetical protein
MNPKPHYRFATRTPGEKLKTLLAHSIPASILSKEHQTPQNKKKCDRGIRYFRANHSKTNYNTDKKAKFESEGVFKAHEIVVKERRSEFSKDLWQKKIRLMSFLMGPKLKNENAPKRHLDAELLGGFKRRNFSMSQLNQNNSQVED